jgi:hypothetical protein
MILPITDGVTYQYASGVNQDIIVRNLTFVAKTTNINNNSIGNLQNVSGSSNNTAFFFFGQSGNPITNITPGWTANGNGVVNGIVTNVIHNADSSIITILSSQSFLSGNFYSFNTNNSTITCNININGAYNTAGNTTLINISPANGSIFYNNINWTVTRLA